MTHPGRETGFSLIQSPHNTDTDVETVTQLLSLCQKQPAKFPVGEKKMNKLGGQLFHMLAVEGGGQLFHMLAVSQSLKLAKRKETLMRKATMKGQSSC